MLTCCWKRVETGNLEGQGGPALWSAGCRVGFGVVAGATELSTAVPWLFAILESLFVAVELGHLALERLEYCIFTATFVERL